MRRTSFLLPGLGMGLLYCSLNIGLILINLRRASGIPGTGKGDPAALLHFAMVALMALGLSFALRKGMGRLRPLAVFLLVAALFCAFLPALPAEIFANLLSGRPPILALCMALFMPVSFFLFFRAVPNGREGFAFALVHVGNELLWTLLFPLFSAVSAQAPAALITYIYYLNCWVVGLAGFCLAIAFGYAVRESAAASDHIAPPVSAGPPLRGKCIALCLAFATGIGIFAITGFHMGSFMPKAVMTPELLGLPYFVLLFLLPVAGRFLDARPDKLMLLCIPGLVVLFCLNLAWQNGLIDRMSLYYPLSIAQQISLLIFYTTTARMLKGKALFPFIICLGYCLHVAHFGGVALHGLVQDMNMPYGVTVASLLLIVGTAICLWRFHAALVKKPELWPVAQNADTSAFLAEFGAEYDLGQMPGQILEPDSGQNPERISEPPVRKQDYTAFGVRFGLSEREILVVTMLAQGHSTEGIAADMNVAESTVRNFVSRILRKTDTKSRAALMELFTAQGRTGA